MNLFTKLRFIQFSYNFEKDYIKNILRQTIGILLILLGILMVLLNLSPELHKGAFLYYLGISLCLVGFFIMLTGDQRLFAKNKLYFKDIDSKVLQKTKTSGVYGDYDIGEFHGQYFLYSRGTNRLLSTTPLKVNLLPNKFILSEDVRKLAPFVLKKFDAPTNSMLFKSKMRLCNDITPGAFIQRKTCELQQADYFSGLCSNEIALKEIWSREHDQMVFSGESLLMDRNLIINLPDSVCANIIEVNSILLTKDGKFLIPRQDSNYANNFNQLIPSISKSMEYANFSDHTMTLQQLLIKNIEDDLRTSFNLKPGELGTFLLGHTRLLNRGGKPEFFAISHTNRTSREIVHTHQLFAPFATVTLFTKNSKELVGMLRYMVELGGEEFSVQLYLNMMLLIDQLETDSRLSQFLNF